MKTYTRTFSLMTVSEETYQELQAKLIDCRMSTALTAIDEGVPSLNMDGIMLVQEKKEEKE